MVGGALTQLDWRLIHHDQHSGGAIGLLVLSRVPKSAQKARPFDWTGQIAAIIGVGGLTFDIIEGAEPGHSGVQVPISFTLAALGAAVFVAGQVRGRHPMVPRQVSGSSIVVLGLSIAFVNMAAFCGVVFLQSLYFQQQRGLDPLATGLHFVPMTVLVVVLNPAVVRAMERFGKLPTMIGGQSLVAAGLMGVSLLPLDAPTIAAALLMVPVGVGHSFTVPPLPPRPGSRFGRPGRNRGRGAQYRTAAGRSIRRCRLRRRTQPSALHQRTSARLPDHRRPHSHRRASLLLIRETNDPTETPMNPSVGR